MASSDRKSLINTGPGETVVYLILWTVTIGLLLIDRLRVHYHTNSLLTTESLLFLARSLTPFILLFVVNNFILIPKLLMRNRLGGYFLAAVALIATCWYFQGFMHPVGEWPHRPPHPEEHTPFRPLFSLPRFLDLIFDLLVVGVNLAVALIFQRYREKLDEESRKKRNAENRLDYLKAQLNPHFYMNMLNNIHGMIEIDPGRAQEMVLDMSHLMRYILYDSSEDMVKLDSELTFVRNYLRLMRIRYPEDKVSIETDFPDSSNSAGIHLPPMTFLTFIENCFKHGVSYRNPTRISIRVHIEDGHIIFHSTNTMAPLPPDHKPGIGIHNVIQRLGLIYGKEFSLWTGEKEGIYEVVLTIPATRLPHEPDQH